MTDNDIYEMINAQIDAALEREYCHIKELKDALQEELAAYSQANKSNSQQMAMIETMIHQHAIGVQNIYNRFTEFKDSKDEELEKLKEEIREISKKVFSNEYDKLIEIG